MLDTRQVRYPLLRGPRPRARGARWRLPEVPPRVVRLGVAALVALVLIGGLVTLARRAAMPDARTELARGLAALKRGNYSAARNHTLAATRADPRDGLAHAVLGRTYLLLGEGVAAEGALARAAANGVAPDRLHQLFADAWRLQGDTDRALAEAARARAPYAAYAARVRAAALAAESDIPAATQVLQGTIARRPRDPAAWSALGRIRFDAGDVSGAGDAAQRAVALDAANLDGLVLRGDVVRSRFGLTAALPWYEAALARDAYFHPALVEYAATLGDAGRYADMLAATRRALAARPGDPHALYLQAVLAARAGKLDLSRAMLAKAGGTGGVPGAVLLAGALDYAAGKYEQAVARWRELVARQPMNIVARRLLGAALLRSGDPRAALEVLRPIALRADADSYTLGLVGRAFEAVGDRGWAARFLDRAARPGGSGPQTFGSDAGLPVLANAVAEAPGDPGVAVAYVGGLVDAGERGAALDRARLLARASPGAPGAHLLVGDVLATSGAFAPAFGAYTRAADLRFDTPTLLRLSEAAERSGRRQAGADALALYLSQNPQSVTARRALANLQLATRDWTAAIDTLEGLRGAIGNRDALVLAQLGYAYAGAGDARAARSYARAAYALAPMNPAAVDAYGWAAYEAGDTAAALQLLRKAAALVPGHAGVQWHYAQALAEAGRAGQARAAIAVALRDPAFADRAPATALLKALPAR